MKRLRALNRVDRLVIFSMIVTMGGVVLGALLKEPNLYGITSPIVIGILSAGWWLTRSPRLAWLLPFGLVAGVLELWSDWPTVGPVGKWRR